MEISLISGEDKVLSSEFVDGVYIIKYRNLYIRESSQIELKLDTKDSKNASVHVGCVQCITAKLTRGSEYDILKIGYDTSIMGRFEKTVTFVTDGGTQKIKITGVVVR